MSEKIYVPKEDNGSVFKIRTSDNALIIPLSYFGYPGVHVTAYSKDLENGERIFDVHLTDEKKDEEIFRRSIKINLNENWERTKKHIKNFEEEIQNLAEKHHKKVVPKGNFYCVNCFVEKELDYSNSIKNKKKAQEFYYLLLNENFGREKAEKIKKYSNCEKEKHDIYLDIEKGGLYSKTAWGFFRFKDQYDFGKRVQSILLKSFKKEIGFWRETKQEMLEILEKYKDEN